MQLEDESIHILREALAQFERPVLLFSAGKDSSVLAHLAHKAFYPAPIPFPFLHIDTGMKFPEMIAFRDQFAKKYGVQMLVYREPSDAHPDRIGPQRCCGILKTQALLHALQMHGFDAAIGGARRDEEKARAKERVFSLRNPRGSWDIQQQRPELWRLYNGKKTPGSSFRIFPLSNWTELEIWRYIQRENISVSNLYFAQKRSVVIRGGVPFVCSPFLRLQREEFPEERMCRFRTLGCVPCTGAVFSEADTLEKILMELAMTRHSERAFRTIDRDSGMERKKQEGYF